MPIGGTETFHRTLLPRLAQDPRIDLKGLAVLMGGHCDHSHAAQLGCPLVTGEKSLRALGESVDVLVTWGIPETSQYLPPRGSAKRPVAIAVSHGDDRSAWTVDVMAACDPGVDRYVAVHEEAAAAIPASRSGDVTIIPNAVDPSRVATDRDRAEIRESLGLASDDVAILYLARLSEEKNPRKTIQAVQKLDPRYRLLMAGDGPEAQACHDLARGFGRQTRLLGKRHDVADLLRASDLFVSMSRSEGFGLSVAEAMLANVPVVATPVGFLAHSPELARIVPVEADADEWAEVIESDWTDAEGRKERTETARLAIGGRYDLDSHVDRWASLLHGLGAARRRESKPKVALGTPHCVPCSQRKPS
jgi:glycosyltransferase involved in cell wall biosynthesis